MNPIPNKFLAILAACLVAVVFCPTGQAQWIAYNFTPQAAYQASYGLSTTNTTNATSTTILTNGWPTSWSNASARGVLALYFSTNTGSPNIFASLPPLVYTFATNTNVLTTNSYQTNLWYLLPTNTNATGSGSLSNAGFFNRTYFTNIPYMLGQYSLLITNASTNVATNVIGSFNAVSVSYGTTNATNTLGTNGVPTNGTAIYPGVLQLRISVLGGTNTNTASNQQLVLPLSLNTALTKIMNTNTNFGTPALTNAGLFSTTSVVYTNLVRLIRSNGTYTNF